MFHIQNWNVILTMATNTLFFKHKIFCLCRLKNRILEGVNKKKNTKILWRSVFKFIQKLKSLFNHKTDDDTNESHHEFAISKLFVLDLCVNIFCSSSAITGSYIKQSVSSMKNHFVFTTATQDTELYKNIFIKERCLSLISSFKVN